MYTFQNIKVMSIIIYFTYRVFQLHYFEIQKYKNICIIIQNIAIII